MIGNENNGKIKKKKTVLTDENHTQYISVATDRRSKAIRLTQESSVLKTFKNTSIK